jgi:hypothetical protein
MYIAYVAHTQPPPPTPSSSSSAAEVTMTLSDLHCFDRLLLSALHFSQNEPEVLFNIIEMDVLIYPKNVGRLI